MSTLEVEPGQLVGLIGPNGAGKTTFIDAVTGFVPLGGRVELDGNDISGCRHTAGPAAVSRGHGNRSSCSTTSPCARTSRSPPATLAAGDVQGAVRPPGDAPRLDEALDAVRARATLAETMPDELTQGQRKLVGSHVRSRAAASCCASTSPPRASTRARAGVRPPAARIVDRGTPILLVDHDMGLVLGISDQVVVLEFGKVIASGTPNEVRHDPAWSRPTSAPARKLNWSRSSNDGR